MNIDKYNLKEMLEKLEHNEYLLPSIQRKFVWDEKQITNLMDSLMLGYPIGTILAWQENANAPITNKYYKFLTEVNLGEPFTLNSVASASLNQNCVLILDGQQRLTSLNISFNGKIKQKGNKADKFLYFNYNKPVTSNKTNFNVKCFEFKFMTDNKGINENWFKVSDIFDPAVVSDIINETNYSTRQLANLKRLKEVVYDDQAFVVCTMPSGSSVYDILSIFSRLNNGGTPLSNHNLIFSVISSHLPNARTNIDTLLEQINKNGFRFMIDYVMKVALCTGGKSINMKVENFTQADAKDIDKRWEPLSRSIELTVTELLSKKLGMNKKHIISENAIVPVNFYIYQRLVEKYANQKGTKRKNFNQYKLSDVINDDEIKEIRRYLAVSQLNKLFISKTDRVVDSLCKFIEDNIQKDFTFDTIKNWKWNDDERTMNVDEKFIDKLFEFKQGSSEAFLALSLLYEDQDFSKLSVDQDHLHPKTLFQGKKFESIFSGLNDDDKQKCKKEYNLLANLHFLESGDNKTKNKTPLQEWIRASYNFAKVKCLPFKKEAEQGKFDNFDVLKFLDFIKERKTLMRKEYKRILGI